MTGTGRTAFTAAEIPRGRTAVEVDLSSGCRLPLTGGRAWRSCGGPPGHHDRSLPRHMEIAAPEGLQRVHLVGVFALHGGEDVPGTVGATVALATGDDVPMHMELVAGRHYDDATEGEPPGGAGDGTSRHTLGSVLLDGVRHRLDVLSVDVPPGVDAGRLTFRSAGACAAFVILDVFMEHVKSHGCPFHEDGGGVPLADLPAIVRLRDRPRFLRAMSLLESSLLAARDLEDAKGQALTFLALTTAALLEVGGGSELHRVQLQAARELDGLRDAASVARAACAWVERVAEPILREPEGPSTHLIDRALGIVDRNYGRDLSDELVAHQLGLSTSHFRHLFKTSVGVPFHKYLVNLRLEKAHAMLVEGGRSVGEVASAVGFAGLSHFSRAFSSRFSVSPTGVRRLAPEPAVGER